MRNLPLTLAGPNEGKHHRAVQWREEVTITLHRVRGHRCDRINEAGDSERREDRPVLKVDWDLPSDRDIFPNIPTREEREEKDKRDQG